MEAERRKNVEKKACGECRFYRKNEKGRMECYVYTKEVRETEKACHNWKEKQK